MSDVLLDVPATGTLVTSDEYPRDGCPACKGPVEAEIVTCDLDEEHERWSCQACPEFDIKEEDLVRVDGPADDAPMLDAAALLTSGRVMPSLVPWVKARVRP